MTAPRVAIVYDWADTRYGGAEKVLLELQKLYPEATLFTSFVTRDATWAKNFKKINSTFLQHLPAFILKHKKLLAPLFPFAFEAFKFDRYDLIISVSSFAAKGVITKPGQLHVCYLLTPTRFLYSHEGDYLPRQNFLTRAAYNYLRRWDQIAAHRPDKIIAISRLVAERCQHYYGITPDDIIYPTIIPQPAKTTPKTTIPDLPAKFFLCVGRLAPYKHLDTVVDICGENNYELVVIGTGPQLSVLKSRIKTRNWSHIHLLQNAPANKVKIYYNKALALIAPGLEDFGINLLEANRAGTLVVTHPDSGARELLSRDAALDLDPEDIHGSLEQILADLWGKSKITAPRQNLSSQDFTAAWLQKVESYEKNR